MSAMWSPQQREWLQAMGYRVLSLAGSEAEPSSPSSGSRVAPALEEDGDTPTRETTTSVRPVSPGDDAPGAAPRPPRPAAAQAATQAAPSEAAAGTRPPGRTITGPERRLYRALLRAAGQRTTRAAEAMLEQLQPDLGALRRDPAGKRALWARLRALRRESGRQ